MLHSICLSLVCLTPGSLYLLILTLIRPFPLPLPFGDHESAFCIFAYVSVLHRDPFAYFKGAGQRVLGREARKSSRAQRAGIGVHTVGVGSGTQAARGRGAAEQRNAGRESSTEYLPPNIISQRKIQNFLSHVKKPSFEIIHSKKVPEACYFYESSPYPLRRPS